MNPKTFIGFAVVTVIVVIAAGISVGVRYSATHVVANNERVFPDLSDQLDNVAEMSVKNALQTLTVKRDGDKWLLAERQNYVASNEAIQKTLVGLSELRFVDAKTKMPDRYSRLAVEDVSAKDAKSRLLTVKDGSGKVLASLIVGRRNAAVAGPSGVGVYIRKPGEDQAWLASGSLDVPDATKKIVPPGIMDVKVGRVHSVSVRQPDGKTMTIEKNVAKKDAFKIKDLPAETKIKYESDVQNVGQGLDELELEDVNAASKISFDVDNLIKTRYQTFDGLVVNVELFENKKDGTFWARFKASTTEPTEIEGGETKMAAKDDDKSDDAAEKKKMDPAAEAAALNKKLSPWAFSLPAYKYRYMARSLDEVIEKKKEDKKKTN
jgi:hypothetical protein